MAAKRTLAAPPSKPKAKAKPKRKPKARAVVKLPADVLAAALRRTDRLALDAAREARVVDLAFVDPATAKPVIKATVPRSKYRRVLDWLGF